MLLIGDRQRACVHTDVLTLGAGGQGSSALETVMARWVERQSEFSGVFQIKLSATATSLLLCADSAALDHIQVGFSAAPGPAFAVPCELRE